MKNTLFLAVLFLSIQFSYGQKTQNHPNENSIYNTAGIDIKPEYPGGRDEFYKYVAKNYNTPIEAKNARGKVYITFVIEIDGSLTDIKVLRDLGNGTGEEAIRVLKSCPKWNPGEMKGQKVRTLFSLPITIN